MNRKFEKWLTIVALGSWVASMGALVAIEVASTQPPSDQSLLSESQAIRPQRRDSQFASVLDSQFYQQLKQSDALASLESDRGHWLDRTRVSSEVLSRDFSELDVKNQKLSISSSLNLFAVSPHIGSMQQKLPR